MDAPPPPTTQNDLIFRVHSSSPLSPPALSSYLLGEKRFISSFIQLGERCLVQELWNSASLETAF